MRDQRAARPLAVGGDSQEWRAGAPALAARRPAGQDKENEAERRRRAAATQRFVGRSRGGGGGVAAKGAAVGGGRRQGAGRRGHVCRGRERRG
ncbi:hypothetical protein BRADI_4g04993v3 [Brachypodium distachyon]|uniref:Uncharacterized protein n=1 Tax=Brachypodium distachyon TaxID=15368 RepID=A0A0Q3EJ06_BRADI|nr:hypothetical protein BRADI_4g04993v3 [Brachypodium distachyon]